MKKAFALFSAVFLVLTAGVFAAGGTLIYEKDRISFDPVSEYGDKSSLQGLIYENSFINEKKAMKAHVKYDFSSGTAGRISIDRARSFKDNSGVKETDISPYMDFADAGKFRAAASGDYPVLISDDSIILLGKNKNGDYYKVFSCSIPRDIIDSLTGGSSCYEDNITACYNKDKLYILSSLYDPLHLPGRVIDFPGFLISVYDENGLIYAGAYESSLEKDAHGTNTGEKFDLYSENGQTAGRLYFE